MSTTDGSRAVVWVEAHMSQMACVCPVAPSAAMADAFAREFSRAADNAWGERLGFIAAESAHSAASACAGFALAGGRAVTFTSGQGLALMQEALHQIAGRRLPLVFHVATRAVTSHARTLHCGHDEIMGAANAGWGILVARNVQEAADFTLIARRVAESAETPFLCAQDGFLTSHTLETVRLPEPEFMRRFIGRPQERIHAPVAPDHPLLSGPVQGPDSYMLGRIAQRFFYASVRPALEAAFEEFAAHTGRSYSMVRCYGMEDAEFALVGMGSMMETAEMTVDYLRRSGIRAGVVSLMSLRPFPAAELARALRHCSAAAVLERTDVPLAAGNPLAAEVTAALAVHGGGSPLPQIYTGVCGLGGREVRPGHLVAAVNNMLREGPRAFVLGIKHPDALEVTSDPDVRPPGSFTVRSHSVGGMRSGAANETLAGIVSRLFGLHVQAYSQYALERRGLPFACHLTLAPEPVRVHEHTEAAEFVAILDRDALEHGNPLDGLTEGGTLYIETAQTARDVANSLPDAMRRVLCRKHIHICTLDAVRIARECAPAGRPDMRQCLRAIAVLGVFFRLTRFRELAGLSETELFDSLANLLANDAEALDCECVPAGVEVIRRGYNEVDILERVEEPAGDAEPVRAPRDLRRSSDSPTAHILLPSGFSEWIVGSYVRGRQSDLTADACTARGLVAPASAQLRSFRAVTPALPVFAPEHCTGCGECAALCPDAALRVKLVAEADIDGIPRTRLAAPAALNGVLFALAVDPDKCKGCGECVQVCGGRRALRMEPKSAVDVGALEDLRDRVAALPDTAAGSCPHSLLPALCTDAFHGGAESCLGCGEAAGLRLMLAATTREYGRDSVAVIAAPGCPSEFSSVYPFNPYEVAWSNALFENSAAEAIGVRMRWEQEGHGRRRLWVVGGYTQMFESGLQSLSRLFTSGLDVKVFVVDTEIYSTAGGSTITDTFAHGPVLDPAEVAQARRERRKELGQIAMMHPGVWVAQTTAAHLDHFQSAIAAANAFAGPALVVCYSVCAREHGTAAGQAVAHARTAVESRAFPLFVYDPRAGERFSECLSLAGNPSVHADWHTPPTTAARFDFIAFARTEPRFASHFLANGEPDEYLRFAAEDRLANWRRLQELAGIR